MEIRNRATGELTTVSQFKALHTNTSFPRTITAEVLDSYGYDVILTGQPPALNGPYERLVRDGVEEIEGQWFEKYIVGPVFGSEEERAAFEQGVDEKAAAVARGRRDKLLSETDWIVTKALEGSAVVDTATSAYRQALRDLPDQTGFPHDIQWPELAQ